MYLFIKNKSKCVCYQYLTDVDLGIGVPKSDVTRANSAHLYDRVGFRYGDKRGDSSGDNCISLCKQRNMQVVTAEAAVVTAAKPWAAGCA